MGSIVMLVLMVAYAALVSAALWAFVKLVQQVLSSAKQQDNKPENYGDSGWWFDGVPDRLKPRFDLDKWDRERPQ